MAQSFFKVTLDNGTTPLILTNNPAGLLDFEITYKRHDVYGTIFRSIGSNLRFTFEGFDYLQSIFQSNGIDSECGILIESINLENKTYSQVYNGIIDFSNYLEDYDYVEVGVLDQSVMAKFIARENIEVNLLDTVNIDGDTITNPLPSPTLLNLSPIRPVYWATSNGAVSGLVIGGGITSNYSQNVYPNGTTNPNYLEGDYNETLLKYTNSSGAPRQIKFKNKYNTNLTGVITVTNAGSPAGVVTFNLKVKRYDTGAVIQTFTFDSDPVIGSYPFSFVDAKDTEFNTSIPNTGSQGIYTEIEVLFDTGVIGDVSYDYETVFEIYEMIYHETGVLYPSVCYGIKPIDVGTRLFEQIGIDTIETPFISNVFGAGGDYELMFFTKGKQIRYFPSDTPINVSMRDFFINYSKMFGLLFFYDNDNFRIEKFDYFYDGASGGILINNISNLKISIAEDLYFSRILCGFDNFDYNDVNGNIEFNTAFEFASINHNTKNTKDLRSAIRGDGLGIEMLRRKQYKNTGSEDVDGDNDMFVISCIYDSSIGGFRAEIGSDFTSIEGIKESDQYYNFRISPKTNLRNNIFYLNTTLNYKPRILKYIGSKNNIPLIINGYSELDGNYTNPGNSLKPIYYEFETILTDALHNFLETMPNTIIEFPLNGGFVEGFLEEANINLYTRIAKIKIVKS